jgi:hypothetical protein
MKQVYPFWIKERFNPQLGTYFVKMGQMSKTAAKRYEKPLYGENVMLRFETREAYNKGIEEIVSQGGKIQ